MGQCVANISWEEPEDKSGMLLTCLLVVVPVLVCYSDMAISCGVSSVVYCNTS